MSGAGRGLNAEQIVVDEVAGWPVGPIVPADPSTPPARQYLDMLAAAHDRLLGPAQGGDYSRAVTVSGVPDSFRVTTGGVQLLVLVIELPEVTG